MKTNTCKLLLLIVNISAIGTGAENTPLIKHFHKHFFPLFSVHQVNIAQPKQTQIHKPSFKPFNTVKGQLKHKQMLIKTQADTVLVLVSQHS